LFIKDPAQPFRGIVTTPRAGGQRLFERRMIVRREGATVRLFTRRGYDWTDRYPGIAAAVAKLRAQSFTLSTHCTAAAR
jgi:hypothetical protein